METKRTSKKGKIISVWSGLGHQNGNTTLTVLLAHTLSNLFPNKNILTMDMNFRFALLGDILGNSSSKSIDDLLNVHCKNSITKEKFCECISEVKINGKETNIYNLNASKNRVFNTPNEYRKAFNSVLENAQDIFDLVIIDNSAGDMDILKLTNNKADIVLNLLKQNKIILDYAKGINALKDFNEDKFMNIVNEYDDTKGMNLDYISKNYKLKNLKKLSYNPELVFYINDDSFYKVLEDTSTFKKELEKIAIDILDKLSIERPTTIGNSKDTGLKKIFSNIKKGKLFKNTAIKEGGE